jgi:hypothetical protein
MDIFEVAANTVWNTTLTIVQGPDLKEFPRKSVALNLKFLKN